MRKTTITLAIASFALGGLVGAYALLAERPVERGAAAGALRPVWTEVQWPFPMDQWGKGKAFRCRPSDCGSEVTVYVRAKIGFCNCTTGVADDDDVDRMGDLGLLGEASPLGTSRPIRIAWMEGRSRAYALNARNPLGKTAISVVFRDRCDMIAATAVLGHDRPAAIEPSVIEFLNGSTVMRWAEITLGL